MIKPDDVPNELAMFAGGFSDVSPRQSRDMVAAILNAAVEAGLVAPVGEAKVLRRALELAHSEIASDNENKYFPRETEPIEAYIEQAREELESEDAGD